jgi:hypothetical protein
MQKFAAKSMVLLWIQEKLMKNGICEIVVASSFYIKGRLTSWIHFSFLFLKCYLPEITEYCSELILLKKII